MDNVWKERFLTAMKRHDYQQEQEFLTLVDQAEGHCSLEIARVLMKSFTASPDFGTQERVVSVLASADKSDMVTAILDELPRLLVDAPDWAEILIGQEVDRRPEFLVRVAKQSRLEVRVALQQLLANQNFNEFYPNAKTILNGIETQR